MYLFFSDVLLQNSFLIKMKIRSKAEEILKREHL